MLHKVLSYFNSISKIIFWLLFVTMVWTTFNLKRWKKAEEGGKIIMWDITSYYGYLPATFIHNDLSLDFVDTDGINYKAKHQFWPLRLNESLEKEEANGKIKVIKTTMGMSFMYAPFFFMGHGFAHISKYEPNGFSQPYEFFLVTSCLFYLFVGLYILRKLLLRYFSELVTGLTLTSILLGTNLFYYATEEPAMSHAYSFALIIGFIYHSILWLEKQQLKNVIYLGLLGGLIVLIRPINLLIFLFPLLYGIAKGRDLFSRFEFFIKNWKHILLIGLLSLSVIFPQLLYWKIQTGNWVFNSYFGEAFFFGNSHVLEGLFSYRKGWLVYTPLMIFALAGVVLLFRKNKNFFAPIFIFLLINTYVLYSWWSWWYGGSFGSRPMIDSYGLLAIPMACFYSEILKKKYLAIPIFTLALFFLFLNQFQGWQRRTNMIHWEGMTKEAYWNVFLKSKFHSEEEWTQQESYLQLPEQDKARKGEDEYDFDPF